MTNFLILTFIAISTAFLSLTGGFLLLLNSSLTNLLRRYGSAIAAIILFYAIFSDLIPEILEEKALPVWQVAFLIFTGLALCSIIGYLARRFHRHGDSSKLTNNSQALTMLIVDTLHTMVDGIALGLAFAANPSTALLIASSTVAHEIPQEIGDFSLMLRSKIPRRQIAKVQLISASVLIPAALLAYYTGSAFTPHLPVILSLMTGFLLHIAVLATIDAYKIFAKPDKPMEKIA